MLSLKNYLLILFIVSCVSSKPPKLLPQQYLSATYYSPDIKRTHYEAIGKGQVAVATQGRFTTKAAFEIFEMGGNLADATVAVSLVQSVERPHSTGLGGGGFLLWGRKKEGQPFVEAWDFRERAPLAAHEEMFIDQSTGKVDAQRSLNGPFSAAVPGLIAGLWEFHRSYGKLSWAELFKPAIRLAEEGFDVYPELASALKGKEELLSKNKEAKKIFFNKSGLLLEGDRLIQRDLAKTLRILSQNGSQAFYRGSLTKLILAEAQRSGLMYTAADFKNYEVKMRPVLKGEFKGFNLYSMPPPSSGGLHVLQILNMLESDPIHQWGPLDKKSVHLNSAAMQRVFVDRAQFLGDPDFIKIPQTELLSKEYAQKLRAEIKIDRARASGDIKVHDLGQSLESDDTIHFSMMDAEGNAVASTQTINGHFGSGIVVAGTGIILNNEMDDFAAAKGASNLFGATALSDANRPEPFKTPLSSMTPTLVEQNGEFVASLGSPSGTRILTCVAQVILNRFVYKMSPWESVTQIRYHHQWQPDEIRVDQPGLPQELNKDLEKMGYKVRTENLGCRIQYVERNLATNVFTAVSDPRAEGAANLR